MDRGRETQTRTGWPAFGTDSVTSIKKRKEFRRCDKWSGPRPAGLVLSYPVPVLRGPPPPRPTLPAHNPRSCPTLPLIPALLPSTSPRLSRFFSSRLLRSSPSRPRSRTARAAGPWTRSPPSRPPPFPPTMPSLLPPSTLLPPAAPPVRSPRPPLLRRGARARPSPPLIRQLPPGEGRRLLLRRRLPGWWLWRRRPGRASSPPRPPPPPPRRRRR